MKSIIFTADEVVATLAGRKRQFRVPLKVQPPKDCEVSVTGNHVYLSARGRGVGDFLLPFAAGDVLWVNETWEAIAAFKDYKRPVSYRVLMVYRADATEKSTHSAPHVSLPIDLKTFTYLEDWIRSESSRWRPASTMPEWASRLRIEITAVRCERVQDICMEECIAEGIALPVPAGCETSDLNFPEGFEKWSEQRKDDWYMGTARSVYFARCADAQDHIDAFQNHWQTPHGKRYPWASNPLVAVGEFRIKT